MLDLLAWVFDFSLLLALLEVAAPADLVVSSSTFLTKGGNISILLLP